MISVCMLGGAGGSSAGVAGYYLTRDQACGLAYYTEHEQVPGRWFGQGAEALALTGPLGPQGAARLEQLLSAQAPDGQTLARPVWRTDPAGRLPGAPLLAALEQVAKARGVPLDELCGAPTDRATLLGIVRRNAASSVPALPRQADPAVGLASPLATIEPTAPARTSKAGGVQVDAAVAGRLATAAGLDPIEVFRGPDGTDRFTPALAKAGTKVDVRRVGVDITASAPKSVSVLQGLADPETAALIEGLPRPGHAPGPGLPAAPSRARLPRPPR